jgi:hypothetical protein
VTLESYQLRMGKSPVENQGCSRYNFLKFSRDTSIVRGALIRGLAERSPKPATIRIGARKARRHYGTLAYEIFDPDKHDHSRK